MLSREFVVCARSNTKEKYQIVRFAWSVKFQFQRQFSKVSVSTYRRFEYIMLMLCHDSTTKVPIQ